MKKDWTYLTKMAANKPVRIVRVVIEGDEVAIEGDFELPPLAKLDSDDQIFAAVFIKCHGSIKQMEKYFNVSYPTIKNRLNRIAEKLDFARVETEVDESDALDRLDKGEIDVNEAIELLKKRRK